jgi:RNA polymerase sigma factor FliA
MPDRTQPDELSSFQSIEMHKALTSAILHLPERERLVFTLYYYEQLKTEEIGLLLGETEKGVIHIRSSVLCLLRAQPADE